MSVSALFEPLRLGGVKLGHRIVMAPLTRMRAGPGNVPGPLALAYYRQRASVGGLIVTEATQISPAGRGYPATPGIHSDDQAVEWRRITDAVHRQGGRIFAQLWHVGRVSHSSHHPEGLVPLAPSAVRSAGTALTPRWERVPFETPRAMVTEEILELLDEFYRAAENARTAGFDGVEIHAANGYLLDQFLEDRTNRRADGYGGSIENRARLLLEVVDIVAEVWGADRVAVRLSPFGTYNDMGDSDPLLLFTHVIRALDQRGLAYLHLVEPRPVGPVAPAATSPQVGRLFRPLFSGPLVVAGGFTPASATAAVEDGTASAVAFGRAFISNPDLPRRIALGASLSPWNPATFYGGGASGYTDYPSLDALGDAA